MNLNDFVVLPNNKARSVKLNARNLQELKMETVTLAEESKEMEEKLQQLKMCMSKEKQERGHSAGFRWKSGQCGSLNSSALTNSSKKNKESQLQKLSAGKVKIRVLKDEPLTAPPQPLPPPPPATTGLRMTRKNRLKGAICGQCEIRTAGLVCTECTEDYCIGCFAKFHQKGALKLHRMIPIQTDLQTHVSTRDVVSYSPSSFTNPTLSPDSKPNPDHPFTSNASARREDRSPEKEAEPPPQMHSYTSQGLDVSHEEEKKVETVEDWLKREDRKESFSLRSSLLSGEYNEEESARSFQEALRQWRGDASDGRGEAESEEPMWIPVQPVSVSAMATQADLSPDREAEGRGSGGRQGRVPVRVEFTENSLTYMDRLLLKKHRRTPVTMYDPPLALASELKSPPNTNKEVDTASSLTAQEEDFRRYCASLFAVPIRRDRSEAQITPPELCLVIEVLDETDRDINGVFVAEQRTNNNRKVPLFQQVSSNTRTLVPPTALTSGGSTIIQPSRQSTSPTHPATAQKLRPSKPQISQGEPPVKSCPIGENPRTSQRSIKTQTSKSQKPSCSPTIHKSKADRASPQLLTSLPHSQTEILNFSCSPLSFPPGMSPLDSTKSSIPKEHLFPSPSTSLSLRSTFTVSPSSSTELTLLPKVYHSTPLQKGSDSSPLPEQPQSSKLFPEAISSLRLSQSPPSNLESLEQSQHSLCDAECLPSDNQLQLEPSLSQTKPVPFRAPVKTMSSLYSLSKSPPHRYFRHRSTPTHGDTPVYTSISGDYESALSHQDPQSIPSHPLQNIQNPPLAMEMEEEEEQSVDSGDEMSSDSLGLASHEEGSSDEDTQMHRRLTSGRSGEEEQGNSATSHLGDFFVPTDAEKERDLQTDEPEQLSKPSMVVHNQSAGSGSEQLCDLDGFSPPGLDLNSGHCDTPEHTYFDPTHSCQTPPHYSDPTGPESRGPSSSLRTYTEEHLVFRVMKDNNTQPSGFQTQSTTPTRTGEISANEPGTSGSNWSDKSTSALSHPPRTASSPLPAPVCTSMPHSPSPSLSARLSRPTLGSELDPVFRPLSRAALEIMEICNVDPTGCEDPDLDADTTAHTLHGLEQELRLMAKETLAPVFGTGNSGSQDQHGNQHLTRDRVSEEQREQEEAAERDRQSVLSLP